MKIVQARPFVQYAATSFCIFSREANLWSLNSNFITKNRIIKISNYSSKASDNKPKLVAVSESRRFMIDCFKAAKASPANAEAMADLLVEADCRGHFSHGMNRLENYINDLLANAVDGKITPCILKETPGTAWVDGQNGLGVVVGNFCMDLAISKAKEAGVGWVCAKRSNHYGAGSWYCLRAMKAGMIGMSLSNAIPRMTHPRGKAAVLGTNPISIGVPAKDDAFLLDMATTAVALGKIEIQRRKGEPIPKGWALGPDGKVTTDPKEAVDTGWLLPLGGTEETSGYKGFGLGAIVDILSGVCAGSNYSTQIKSRQEGGNAPTNLGHTFVAVNPNFFAPGFENRMLDFNNRLRSGTPVDPQKPVVIPGESGRRIRKATDRAGGIKYVKNQWESCEALAKRLKVAPLKPL